MTKDMKYQNLMSIKTIKNKFYLTIYFLMDTTNYIYLTIYFFYGHNL